MKVKSISFTRFEKREYKKIYKKHERCIFLNTVNKVKRDFIKPELDTILIL